MKCTVLLFAQLREAVGSDRISIELPNGSTVADALDALASKHPSIAALKSSIAVAVDETYRPPTFPLNDGCTIALIPPVSGG
jgi:molybdopterin converting factor subunit 1